MELKESLFAGLKVEVQADQIEKESSDKKVAICKTENIGKVIKVKNRLFTQDSLKNYTEMLIHTALNTHKEAKKILVVGGVKSFVIAEIERYFDINLTVDYINLSESSEEIFETQDNLKHKYNFVTSSDVKEFISAQENDIYDVVIFDEVELEKVTMAHVNRVLSETGVFGTYSSAFGDDESLVSNLTAVSNEFIIAMPYFVNLMLPTTAVFLLGSKKYHPTADIILQRADLLDGLDYYNSEVQEASFKQPNHIRKLLKGIVKN